MMKKQSNQSEIMDLTIVFKSKSVLFLGFDYRLTNSTNLVIDNKHEAINQWINMLSIQGRQTNKIIDGRINLLSKALKWIKHEE